MLIGACAPPSGASFTACSAALDMVAAADRFNQERAEDERLPVRIGLTVGAVTLRSDADRGAFEAVGDAVNVASRLQEVNRQLGTTIFAAAPVVEGFGDAFMLAKVEVPVGMKGVSHTPDVMTIGQSA